MPGEPGLHIVTFSAEEGSPSADRLVLLAAWAATQEFEAAGGADDSDSDNAAPR